MGNKYRFRYTEEHIKFLRENIRGTSYRLVTQRFNERFGLDFSVSRIGGTIKRLDLQNGRKTTFYKGQESWNKGKKGTHLSPKTEFQKGHTPQNHRPVGSERINADGYVEVKIAEPKTWRAKHRIIWEREHGPVPSGYVVIMADGNPLNIELDNLLLVSRAELLILNRQGLIKENAEATQSGVHLARLIIAMNKRKKAEG